MTNEIQANLSGRASQQMVEKPPITAPPPQVIGSEVISDQSTPVDRLPLQRSWVFRFFDFVGWISSRAFGMASVIFLLALASNIPLIQFLSFGYLLEVTGRIARTRKLSSAFIGLDKASRMGSAILGAWLLLIPVRFVSQLSLEAKLIDPSSSQTAFMQGLLGLLILLTVAHIAAAWFCGGKLRYFFWPVVAPFSFFVWLTRRLAGSNLFRRILGLTIGWLSPRLVEDLCNAQPVSDWFLPAILWKKLTNENAYQNARDGFWEFCSELRLGYYFRLGIKGFLGTCLWLLAPTLLLVVSTSLGGAAAIVTGLLGTLLAIPVFCLLPFLQAHFATDGRLTRFWEVRHVLGNVGRAPFAHVVALLLALLFALPLFLLKVEEIPTELLWSLSLVFVLFTWPAKVAIGWAYGRGTGRSKSHHWLIRYPVLALAMPICFSFVFILFFTRYITWNGALSLVENHVFLLPAPFWLSL